MLLSFLGFLAFFTLVGLSSFFKSRGTKNDYYLASSTIPPAFVGLSAVATNNSGYMFIGVIGYTYHVGMAALWLMLGWIAGDFIASLLIHKPLKTAADKSGQASYAGVISHWHGTPLSKLQRTIALVSLVFLIAYAAAQLVAGSKALHVLLDWPLWAGACVGAVMVGLYCMAGGIRASIWTDVAQSLVMIIAMAILLIVAINNQGGLDLAWRKLQQIEGYTDWIPGDLLLPGMRGLLLFIIAWVFAGFSVIGQPHIMLRFITLKNSQLMVQARLWYYLWFVLFYFMATGVGMLSRLYFSKIGSFDAELALPSMALTLLPEFWVGLILAGIFAATMSTADSLVLSCSAAVTHDLVPGEIKKTRSLKIATLCICIAALLLALSNNQSVFSLVLFAWSGLASALAPLLLFYVFKQRPSERLSILALLAGLGVAILWRVCGLHAHIYEGLPGIIVGVLILSLERLSRQP